MAKKIPWQDIDGRKYNSVEVVVHKDYVKITAWMIGFILIGMGIFTKNILGMVFGICFLLAMIMKKSKAFTERGLELFNDMRITSSYSFWDWKDIDVLTYEYKKEHKKAVLFYITKGDRTKKIYFDKNDKGNILKLAGEKNPNIKIYDAEKEREKLK